MKCIVLSLNSGGNVPLCVFETKSIESVTSEIEKLSEPYVKAISLMEEAYKRFGSPSKHYRKAQNHFIEVCKHPIHFKGHHYSIMSFAPRKIKVLPLEEYTMSLEVKEAPDPMSGF